MPKKLDRCVRKVRAAQRGKKKKYNPYAVCKASLKKSKSKTSKNPEKKKKVFGIFNI